LVETPSRFGVLIGRDLFQKAATRFSGLCFSREYSMGFVKLAPQGIPAK
jgi:hypothetical protein